MTDKQVIVDGKTFIVLKLKQKFRQNPRHRINTVDYLDLKYSVISKLFNVEIIDANPDIFKDIYIFGGAVTDMLLDVNFNDIADFDICILSKTNEEFLNKLHILKDSMNIINDNTYANRFIITYSVSHIDDNKHCSRIEVATKLISSLTDLFKCIDIPATACVYNLFNRHIVMTKDCLRSLETKQIFIDLSKCNWSYEYRLNKYFWKGFDILLDSSLIPNYNGDILSNIKKDVNYGLSSLIYKTFKNVGYDINKTDIHKIGDNKLVVDKTCEELYKISIDGMTYGQKTDWLTLEQQLIYFDKKVV
jgi:hypothetical protein